VTSGPYRIVNTATGAFYTAEITGGVFHPEDALSWEDIGEAGYVVDQLNERDDGLYVLAHGKLVQLDAESWQVVERP